MGTAALVINHRGQRVRRRELGLLRAEAALRLVRDEIKRKLRLRLRGCFACRPRGCRRWEVPRLAYARFALILRSPCMSGGRY